ncbi:hypothetical protein F2P81_011424 [Scophthalmus maximus]|uniref:Uncharacterized protein n=1 Tax=Scophthalmus maximus TaxID=52904 RepID=A0A6A4T1J5_SCOMX|nr:hypothetical protein F2P81_011424 [Scophthalmus maximus]
MRQGCRLSSLQRSQAVGSVGKASRRRAERGGVCVGPVVRLSVRIVRLRVFAGQRVRVSGSLFGRVQLRRTAEQPAEHRKRPPDEEGSSSAFLAADAADRLDSCRMSEVQRSEWRRVIGRIDLV